jgi:hypothetical protein
MATKIEEEVASLKRIGSFGQVNCVEEYEGIDWGLNADYKNIRLQSSSMGLDINTTRSFQTFTVSRASVEDAVGEWIDNNGTYNFTTNTTATPTSVAPAKKKPLKRGEYNRIRGEAYKVVTEAIDNDSARRRKYLEYDKQMYMYNSPARAGKSKRTEEVAYRASKNSPRGRAISVEPILVGLMEEPEDE